VNSPAFTFISYSDDVDSRVLQKYWLTFNGVHVGKFQKMDIFRHFFVLNRSIIENVNDGTI
jgi:hypothetical protein